MRRWFLAYVALFVALLASWGSFAQLTATGVGGGGFGGSAAGCTVTGTLSVDSGGVFTALGTGGTTVLVNNLITNSTNDVLIAIVGNNRTVGQGSATTVSGVADTNSNSWLPRGHFSFATGGSVPGTPFLDVAIFYAIVAATQNINVTATFGATVDNSTIIAFGVNGANTTTPWDTNGSLPATGSSNVSSAPSISGVSTTCNKTMLLMAAQSANTSSGIADQTAGTGFTMLANQNSSGGTNFSKGAAEQDIVAATQSGITTSFAVSWNGWAAVTDAIQAAP